MPVKGEVKSERVEFLSRGTVCVGDLHQPAWLPIDMKLPAVVLGNGFGGIRDAVNAQALGFAAAGYRALSIDYRYFGDSGGTPRSQLFPLEQVEDFRNAISYMALRDDVDEGAITIWGTSFAGGIVLYTAAVDTRVRAVIAQVPVVDGYSWMRSMRNPAQWLALLDVIASDRERRYRGDEGEFISRFHLRSELTPCGIPADEELLRFANDGAAARRAVNKDGSTILSIESIERIMEFSPARFIDRIAPRHLLIVTTAGYDFVHPYEAVAQAYERALEPKTMMPLNMSQLDMYQEPGLGVALQLQTKWLAERVPAVAAA